MSCDHELANEWARCSGKNASYITTKVIFVFVFPVWSRSHYAGEHFTLEGIKYLPSTLRRRNLKTQQSPVIIQEEESHDCRNDIVFKKLRFRERLLWTVDRALNVNYNLIPSVSHLTAPLPPLPKERVLSWNEVAETTTLS